MYTDSDSQSFKNKPKFTYNIYINMKDIKKYKNFKNILYVLHKTASHS